MKRTFPALCALLGLFLVACVPSAAAEEEAKKKEKKYTIAVVAEPQAVVRDKDAKYKITITPKKNFVLKTETPFTAKLTSSTGCKLAKDKFSNKEFDDPKAVAKSVSTVFKAAAGKHEISADLTFFICDETLCERFKEKPQLTFEVK